MEQKDIEKILNKKYFYCANLNCNEIKRNDYVFCDKHTVYNTSVLKNKPIEVNKSVIATIILQETDNIKYKMVINI